MDAGLHGLPLEGWGAGGAARRPPTLSTARIARPALDPTTDIATAPPPAAPRRRRRQQSDPEIAAGMKNPKVMKALQELLSGPGGPMSAMSNPAKLQEMMADPEVRERR